MSYSKLSSPGQIFRGDKIILVDVEGKIRKCKAKAIINQNTDKEEIIINKKRNSYFIVSMYLNGSSWVKALAYEPQLNRDLK